MAYNFVQASNQRLTTSTAPVINGPLTFSAWFRRDAIATGTKSILVMENSVNANRFQVFLTNLNQARCTLLYNNGSLGGSPPVVVIIPSGQWRHAAASVSANEAPFITSFYLSGSKSTFLATTPGTGGGYNTFSIGSYFGTTSYGGDIADVGIWDVALTDPEIASLSKGVACSKVRPQSLRFYAPLIRNLVDLYGQPITSTNSPIVSNHTRIYM